MTDTAELTDIDSLVDINIAPQCEHPRHKQNQFHYGDAAYLIKQAAPCGHPQNITAMMCKSAFDFVGLSGLQCQTCFVWYHRDEIWTILEVL